MSYLLSTIVVKATLKIFFKEKVEVQKIYNKKWEKCENYYEIEIGNLSSEQEKEFLAEVKVNKID